MTLFVSEGEVQDSIESTATQIAGQKRPIGSTTKRVDVEDDLRSFQEVTYIGLHPPKEDLKRGPVKSLQACMEERVFFLHRIRAIFGLSFDEEKQFSTPCNNAYDDIRILRASQRPHSKNWGDEQNQNLRTRW